MDRECGMLTIAAFSFVYRGAMHIAVFDVASGDLTKHGYSSAGHKIDPSSLHALETGALALTVDKSRVCSIAFFGGKSVSCQTMKEVLPSGTRSASAVALSGTCPEEAVLQTSEGAVILGLQSSGGALAVTFVAGAVSSGCGDIQVAAARASEDGVTVDMISSSDGVIAKTLTAPDLRRVTVSGTPLRAVSSFAGPFGEVLVQLEEGTLAFFSPGASTEAAWIRNEALSGVTDLLFADLPAPTQENEAQWAAQQPSTSESLRMQLLALKVQVGMATSEEAAAVERHAALTSDRLRPTRDPDGFRKQLLVTTAAGKVASLHTGDGRVMWSLDFGPGAAPNRLTAWHTPHDTTHDALVAAIASSSDGVAVTVINIRTGEAVERESIAAKDADILLLPRPVHVDTADQSVLVVVPKDGGAPVVLPKTDAARAAFAEQAAGIVRWAVSADGSGIEGVGVSAGGKSKQLWRVAAAPEGSKLEILAVAAREANEAVYSAALPVFGGGVLLKNLNPNTLLVVAGPPKGTPAGKDSKLVATLIDAASGRVLFTQTHTVSSC